MANPQPRPDKHYELTVVVSGQPLAVRVNAKQTLEHVIREALNSSGNHGQAPSDWELRREDGALLDQQQRANDAGLHDGVTLFLNPRAGAGG